MTHHPMSPPDPFETPTGDENRSSPLAEPGPNRQESELAAIARTLAAHGGGATSFDLALDLVLNEVVEQARLATSATGAAIALARDGKMVCRATTGAAAPDLGVRLETKSGLSGACLQTGNLQQCDDADADSRVNAAASRALGVKSILVLPLADQGAPFGVLEVFSPRPNAFGDRDVTTLQVLARRVVESKRGAEKVSALLANGDEAPERPNPPEPRSIEKHFLDSDQTMITDAPTASKRTDILTPLLGVLVIMAAVLLGLVLGWRGASVKGLRARPQERDTASTDMPAGQTMNTTKGQTTIPVPLSESAEQAKDISTPQPNAAGAATSAEAPDGGLVVSQNGRIIFRSTPTNTSETVRTTAGSDGGSPSRLIHRVEPEYPAGARAQHIQGVVALDVQIGKDGAVRNIAVVEGNPLLAEAAVQTVRQWRYRPYAVDGRPVEMQTRVTIRFTLPPPQQQ